MASGTVGYTDTRGNKDFSSVIASQIGKRLKEASDMAADERAFASKQAEAGGTSLEEAGIGKGYFFKRALGNRFGGDRIARTKGRMGVGGAANNPAANYKQRFRGGFDYKVTNELNNLTDTGPLSNALVTGLRGVQIGLTNVSQSISKQDATLKGLANTQADMAKAIMFNGYLFQMFASQQQQEATRRSARREERSMERRGGGYGGGGGFGGSGTSSYGGGGRNMINVTPSGGSGTSSNALRSLDTLQTGVGVVSNPKKLKYIGGISKASNIASAVDIGKIAKKTGNLLKVPGTAIRSAFTNVKNLNALKSFKALKDTITAQSAAGLLGLRLNPVKQLRNFFGNSPFDPSVPKNLVDMAIHQGAKDAVLDRYPQLLEMIATPDYAEETLEAAVRFSPNPNYVEPATDILGKPIRKITKKLPQKVAEEATPQRIADLAEAGVKTADIATDQIVKQGTKQGLKKGSKLTKMMVKRFGAAGTRSILKKIPIVAGLAGVAFGIQRAMEGDLLGAGLEITSGLLGATGVGGGAGLAIDGFLLGRDLGMIPMRTGGTIYPGRSNSPLMVGGKMFNFNEPGNKEIVRVEKDDDNRFVDMGIGFVEGMKKKKNEYISLQATGVESALSGLKGSGFFGSMFDNVANTVNTTKNILSNLNLGNVVEGVKNFIPKSNPLDSIKNWFNKGYTPKEDTMKWKDLMADDWKQRGKFGKGGKLGGWDFTRGFRPGVAANEGGFGSGPTPAGRQAVKRGFGFLSSFRGGALTTLASLVANEFINPQPLADGTMDGYMKSVGGNNSMKLQNENVNPIATTVINNNYYNGGGQGGGQESANENLGQSFNDDLTKFITGFSIMSK